MSGAPASLCTRLRERREEIEESALNRVRAVSDPRETADLEYMQGLRAAVSAAIEYGIDTLERSEGRVPPIPTALLSQARLAARNHVPLDTVLRRYFAGYILLGDFVIEEAERVEHAGGLPLKRLLRMQAALFDRLISAVTEEYARETRQPKSGDERRRELVRRLLDGELIDTTELTYEFGGWHLGAIANGPGAVTALRRSARALDRRLLLVLAANHNVWAWFGSGRPFESTALATSIEDSVGQVSVAFGEPCHGLAGWRLTHRQAQAAFTIALREPSVPVRYGDVALLASISSDDLLITSLRQLYLAPLETERDRGEVSKETLRAYFAAERNISSAAAYLGVNRHTVASRLAAIEEKLNRSIASHAADFEAALRLEDLRQSVGFHDRYPATLAGKK